MRPHVRYPHRFTFWLIRRLCAHILRGKHNTIQNRLTIAAALSRLAANIRDASCTAEVLR